MMKLFITDHADPSVGMFEQYWVVECPFEKSNADDEIFKLFKEDIGKIYGDFCDGKMTMQYDFEIEAENKALGEVINEELQERDKSIHRSGDDF